MQLPDPEASCLTSFLTISGVRGGQGKRMHRGQESSSLQRLEGQDSSLFHAKQEVVNRPACSHGGRHTFCRKLRVPASEKGSQWLCFSPALSLGGFGAGFHILLNCPKDTACRHQGQPHTPQGPSQAGAACGGQHTHPFCGARPAGDHWPLPPFLEVGACQQGEHRVAWRGVRTWSLRKGPKSF